MLRLLSGKVILGGLGLTLFAKAAMSFPELPMFNTVDPVQDVAVVQTAAAEKKDAAPEPAKDVPPLVADLPMGGSECEAPEDVLRSLARERELVELQKQEVLDRQAELALARERLAIEKGSLTELQASIEALLGRIEANKTDDLNDFYKNMKPADAARIMDDLDIETTVMVRGTMNPRSAAPILAKVSPVRARAVSKIILERSQLPGDQDLVGIKLK